MKNYYDELEVSKTASKEVIEKDYKVLAKKYHPDSTTESDRAAAEERFKAISEAYNTLSDDFKRKEYDKELAESSPNISYEEYEYVLNKNKDLEDEIDYLHQRMNNTTAAVKRFHNRCAVNPVPDFAFPLTLKNLSQHCSSIYFKNKFWLSLQIK